MLNNILSLVEIYKNNPADSRLNTPEYLRLIRYFDQTGKRDMAVDLSGYYAGNYHKVFLCSALMTKAMIAYAEERYEDAIKHLTDIIDIQPTAHAYSVRGICFAQSTRENGTQLAVEDHIKAGELIEFQGGEEV